MFIGVRNVPVALVYVLGQLLEMFISRRNVLFAFPSFGLAPGITIMVEEDELLGGADPVFLREEEVCTLGIGFRIVLGMGSKRWVTMCLISFSSCS
jgi:hypothetical protein